MVLQPAVLVSQPLDPFALQVVTPAPLDPTLDSASTHSSVCLSRLSLLFFILISSSSQDSDATVRPSRRPLPPPDSQPALGPMVSLFFSSFLRHLILFQMDAVHFYRDL